MTAERRVVVTGLGTTTPVGGTVPAAPGASTGEVARVPYTAEYVFYRAHHTAWQVKDVNELRSWRARLERQGVNVSPDTKHELIESIYFEDPNNISLEMCYWPRDLDRDPLFVDRDPIPAAREITLS